ncbi:MAG TPA: MBL fold metallo-hydrolase [Paenibacillus sp.]
MEIPELTKWEHGITQVKISMSYPLRWVNSYVLQGTSGVAIIDPGPRSREAEEEWSKALGGMGLTVLDVSEVLLTHHHPDHYGLAGWIQTQSSCRVYMSQRAYEETLLTWGSAATLNHELPSWFRQHGLPELLINQIVEHMEVFLSQVSPQPEVTLLEEGVAFEFGGRSWIPVETGGHAPGHISLYDKELGIMVCGDAVLPQISPNVSLIPGSDPDPLHTFIQGLNRLRQYEVRLAFPGHRNPFTTFHKRIDDLLAHHEERLDMVEELLVGSPRSGYEICMSLFRSKLTIHQMRFAMCEALAHIQELVRRGKAEVAYPDDETSPIKYIALL